MASDSSEVLLRAAGMGIITGLRSMAGPALISYRAARHPGDLAETPLRLLASDRMRTLLTLSAAGEVIVDKLPFVPPRTSPGPLAGRILLGAVAGAAMCIEERQPPLIGTLLGAGGGLAGSYLGRAFREAAKQRLHLSYTVSGLIEDAAAFVVGRRIAGV